MEPDEAEIDHLLPQQRVEIELREHDFTVEQHNENIENEELESL